MTTLDLTDLLLRRIIEAQGKAHLQNLLLAAKADQKLPPQSFRAVGNRDEVAEATRIAIANGHVKEAQLAALVDQLEENGGQHVFLFDLTADGRKHLTSKHLGAAFPALPAKPTAAMYTDLPSTTRTYFISRPDGLFVKQIFTAGYWERDDKESSESESRRVQVSVKRYRRAINLLRVDPERNQVEFRIDRVRGDDDSLAGQMFVDFCTALKDVLDLGSDVTTVPIWSAFPAIVASTDETFMAVDEARDASVALRISNRREGDRGRDVREHPSYVMRGEAYARDSLNVYWYVPDDGRLHTILSRLQLDKQRSYGKVYVAAKAEPQELAYVLERVRHFAG